MEPKPSPAVALAVQALQRTHPNAPPLDVLDLVMQGRAGSVAEIADADCPGSALGQLLAACFDRVLTPEEWRGLTGPTAERDLAESLEVVWHDEVLARFAKRYSLTMADGQQPVVPEIQFRNRMVRAF